MSDDDGILWVDDGVSGGEAKEEAVYTVEVRCQALKRTLGLIDHYYLVIGAYEYHVGGAHSGGSVQPVGTTKGAHTVAVKTVCSACYTRTVENYRRGEDRRLFNYYPLINCETLATGLSLQTVSAMAAPFVFVLVTLGRILWAVVLTLAALVFFLSSSKYAFSRTHYQTCRHLRHSQTREKIK